jgi:hypothetical protein
LGVVEHAKIPALRRMRQEDHKFEADLGYKKIDKYTHIHFISVLATHFYSIGRKRGNGTLLISIPPAL